MRDRNSGSVRRRKRVLDAVKVEFGSIFRRPWLAARPVIRLFEEVGEYYAG
jgi:hypothetical protein